MFRQIHIRKIFQVLLNAKMQVQPLAVGIPNLLLSEKLGGYGQELDCCVPLLFFLLFLKVPETVRDTHQVRGALSLTFYVCLCGFRPFTVQFSVLNCLQRNVCREFSAEILAGVLDTV